MMSTLAASRDLTAKDVMRRHFVSIPEQLSIRAAADLLRQAQVSAAPVVDELGRSVGVLLAVDLLRCTEEGGTAEPPRTLGVSSCPYQTTGRLLNGAEGVICTLAEGNCPLQELWPMTGGRQTAMCLLPPRVAAERRPAIKTPPLETAGCRMRADAVTVAPRTPLPELARMMIGAAIELITVIDEQRKPVGIVSSTDILKSLLPQTQA